ncbi:MULTISPECIES: cytochrome P450 [unclassified Cyanobium]|uniref:cytochrome P450 n=1 Tax=unclassified Cyanobium TaxID=2627006 RepID=UPI0020CEBD1A|nr:MULTISPECIES: cytochrome P450 [unclassified Cyanobium]MCP9861219.1 cytochrome P450 [Cyanobium sp. Cruz-8H5]MCP9868455.1 cytochrome P450 [Cyanobium sp. Cruz-8D1]
MSGVLETLAFFRDPDFARSRFERYGDVYETSLLGQRTVFIRGEPAIGDLFAQAEAVEGWWPDSVRQLLGPLSLANRNGADHKARRRVVGQLFASAALRRYIPEIVALVGALNQELLGAEAPVALVPRLRRFAFRVIATTVLGLDGVDRESLFLDFETWCQGLFSLPFALPGSPFARARQARKRLLLRLGAVLKKGQAAAASGAPLAAGGLDLLAGGLDEAGLPLADDDVAEQLLLLLFAGYETTASSLSCLVLTLLQHPAELAWLLEELDSLPWPPAEGEAVTAYDALRAPRLDAVVKEVMRLTPPVGGFFRRTREPMALAGVLVPADRVVQVSISASHRHGADLEDLAAFRPQRHLGGDATVFLLPYGGGERVCLGKALAELEIRLLAVGLLKQLSLGLEPDQDLALMVTPSPSPKDGLRVRPRRRATAAGPVGVP